MISLSTFGKDDWKKLKAANNSFGMQPCCRRAAGRVALLAFVLAVVLLSPALADDGTWQIEVANDSPNGFKFSDAYETHSMRLSRISKNMETSLTAALVAPKRPENIDEDRPANRSFGELLSFRQVRPWHKRGEGTLSFGSQVTFIGKFGLDSLQEEFHDLLGYRSVKDQLVSHRMEDAIMVSALFGYQRQVKGGKLFSVEAEIGTQRNAVSAVLEKPAHCEDWDWSYHARIEAIANDEVVSAGPVNADIRHIVPTLGLGFCRSWQGYRISLTEEISLPRIRADNAVFPMVRLQVSF